MRGLVKIALLAMMLAGAATAYGQDISTFRSGLSEPDTLSHASVRVSEHGTAAGATENYDSAGHPAVVEGYRVCIFFDNSQAAGKDSAAAQERFRGEFPSIPTYRAYENPSWIVTVGNCVTAEEALVLQNKVAGSFKTAFPRKVAIPIAEFLKEGDGLPESVEIKTDEYKAS
jgi:hypothetical protein